MNDLYLQRLARIARGEISDESLALINVYALRALSRDEVIVRGAQVANDQTDAYMTRFTPEALAQIAAKLPGSPVMRNHSAWGSEDLPVGIWFDAKVEQRDGTNWVVGQFYMVREPLTDSIAARMDGGIIREVSLAWMMRSIDVKCSICGKDETDPLCDHIPGVDYQGRMCEWILTSVRSVEEASLVWKGGQYGTSIEMPAGAEKRITLMQRMAVRQSAKPAPTPGAQNEIAEWFEVQGRSVDSLFDAH